jgi:hypothetical protein
MTPNALEKRRWRARHSLEQDLNPKRHRNSSISKAIQGRRVRQIKPIEEHLNSSYLLRQDS